MILYDCSHYSAIRLFYYLFILFSFPIPHINLFNEGGYQRKFIAMMIINHYSNKNLEFFFDII